MRYVLKKQPISVIMAVHNGEKFVGKTIESILQQTFTDFEFIIVDDGSTDSTHQILQHYAEQDARIQLLSNEHQQGIAYSSNRALALARGRYIAVTDADDISRADRLYKQVRFLDEHPDIGVVGTRTRFINARGQELPMVDAKPTEAGMVGWILFFGYCVAHSSAMVRREIYQQLQGYAPEYFEALDYDLWLRARVVTQIANLPDVLLAYRIHSESVSHRYRQRQQECGLLAQQRALSAFLGKTILPEVARALRYGVRSISLRHAYRAALILFELYRSYTQLTPLSANVRRQVRFSFYKQLLYLILKASDLLPIIARLLGGTFRPLHRFANFIKF